MIVLYSVDLFRSCKLHNSALEQKNTFVNIKVSIIHFHIHSLETDCRTDYIIKQDLAEQSPLC